jgi:hypothetical protein
VLGRLELIQTSCRALAAFAASQEFTIELPWRVGLHYAPSRMKIR